MVTRGPSTLKGAAPDARPLGSTVPSVCIPQLRGTSILTELCFDDSEAGTQTARCGFSNVTFGALAASKAAIGRTAPQTDSSMRNPKPLTGSQLPSRGSELGLQSTSRGSRHSRRIGGGILCLGVVSCAFTGVTSLAHAEAPLGSGSTSGIGAGPHVQVEWVAESPLVPGQTTRTAVLFTIEDGWHTYGQAENDTGFPARFEPVLPPGITLVGEAWPTPERHASPGDILDHIYEDQVAIFLDLSTAPDLEPGDVELGLGINWLVCREACVFEGDSLGVTWKVATPKDSPPPTPVAYQAAVPFLAKIPVPLPVDTDIQIEVIPGATREMKIRVPEAKQIAFLPAPNAARPENPIEDAFARGNKLDIRFAPDAGDVTGTLVVERAGQFEYYAIP